MSKKKKNKKENTATKGSWFNLLAFYCFIILVGIAIPSDRKLVSLDYLSPWEKDGFIFLVGLCLFVVHYALVSSRRGLVPYGKMFLNVHVFDWGPYGKSFDMPEHLKTPFAHWVACSPDQVELTVQQVKEALTRARNKRFISPEHEKLRINVVGHYFRRGVDCNQSAKDYHKKCIDILEQDRLDFFTFIEGEDSPVDSKWVINNYFKPGYNGSKLF